MNIYPALALIIIFALSSNLHAQGKTLKRIDDPVVVLGEKLKPLLGTNLKRLTLMAWTGQGLEPIPFQVDEKTPEGKYAFNKGPKAEKDTDPLLDSNDELASPPWLYQFV